MFKVTFNDLVIIAMEIHLFPCRTQKLSPSTAEVLGGCPLGDRRVAKLKVWSVGQGVKTPPFHGGNTGSNPVRTIMWRITQVRLKGTVLKTVRRVKACVGSNPTSSLIILSRDGAAR